MHRACACAIKRKNQTFSPLFFQATKKRFLFSFSLKIGILEYFMKLGSNLDLVAEPVVRKSVSK